MCICVFKRAQAGSCASRASHCYMNQAKLRFPLSLTIVTANVHGGVYFPARESRLYAQARETTRIRKNKNLARGVGYWRGRGLDSKTERSRSLRSRITIYMSRYQKSIKTDDITTFTNDVFPSGNHALPFPAETPPPLSRSNLVYLLLVVIPLS